MTRVPTTATYNVYMSQITRQKSIMNDISYQAITGNKYASYDKYGLSAYRLLSLQNEQSVTSKYLEINSVTQVVFEAEQKAVDSIRSSVIDFRNQLREFYANDLTSMSKNPTEEELIALQNVQEAAFEAMSMMAYYLNTEVDGNYIFGGGVTNTRPVDFPYTTLEEFQAAYDGKFLTYPTSNSASLSKMESNSSVTGGITMEQLYQTLQPKHHVISGSVGNAMNFSNVDNSITADPGTFSDLSVGAKVTITGTGSNNGTWTVKEVSANGAQVIFEETVTNETMPSSAGVDMATGSWIFDSITNLETGETTHSLTGAVGSFSDLIVGEMIKVEGTASNDGYLTVKEISDDGRTVVFEEPVTNETIATAADLANVQIRQSTYEGTITAQSSVGEVINSFDFDALTNPLTVDTVNNTITAAVPGVFRDISAGQTITINENGTEHVLYVKSVSADGKSLEISSSTPVPSTNITSGQVTVSTRSDIGGFITGSMKGSALKTGDISFDAVKNTMSASVKGAFDTYRPGDTIIIKGADDNDKAYVIKSVSEDGRTIEFDESTPVAETMNLNNGKQITDGKGITICSSYPVGSTISMGHTNGTYDGDYTVLGVSDDGQTLKVKTNNFPEYDSNVTFNTGDIATNSYYQGGYLSTTYRISGSSQVTDDITAASSAFEKLFRAMGMIAQGNMLDSDNIESAGERVKEALDILDEALSASSKEKNGDVTSIQYSVITKLDRVKTTIDYQTDVQNSLETYINALSKVDKTEAVTLLLQAQEDLQVSYSVLGKMTKLTLLNYL